MPPWQARRLALQLLHCRATLPPPHRAVHSLAPPSRSSREHPSVACQIAPRRTACPAARRLTTGAPVAEPLWAWPRGPRASQTRLLPRPRIGAGHARVQPGRWRALLAKPLQWSHLAMIRDSPLAIGLIAQLTICLATARQHGSWDCPWKHPPQRVRCLTHDQDQDSSGAGSLFHCPPTTSPSPAPRPGPLPAEGPAA